jgi:subtilisin-like proprotein convertase family protein
MKKALLGLLIVVFSAGFIGCGSGGEEEITCDNLPLGKIKQECIDKSAPKADRWDSENDPTLFGVELDTVLVDLPQQADVAEPAWPADYWATYLDSVNKRWQTGDTYSPVEKYDLAFNDWTPPANFETMLPFKACAQEFDQEYYDSLGPAAKYWSNNKGNKVKRDKWNGTYEECEEAIETWWGLCHAWVPAAILEPEPQKAVTYNGVTFEVSDMKALLLMAYNRSSTRFLGKRCNLKNDEIERDEYGRIVDSQSECRDTNPGSLHLILANLVGRDKRGFAEDRTTAYQVWNQPVVGYEVKRMEEITEEEATRLLDPDCDPCEYIWNTDAEKFYDVETHVYYVTESNPSTQPMLPNLSSYTRTDRYNYTLELDGSGNIIGGEWLSATGDGYPARFDSQMDHPDFLWLPLRAGYATNRYASLEKIRMLVRMSQEDNPPVEGDAKVFTSEEVVSIPDNDAAGAASTIEVTEDIDLTTLKVTVAITHTYIGDLTLTLRRGTEEYELQKNAGGSTDNINKTFEVSGVTGSVRGTWELVVSDNASRDTGTIDSWELIAIGGSSSSASTVSFSSNSGVAIPDNDTNGVVSSITASGSGAIKGLKVTVDIDHTWISDLRVTLLHGTGKAVLHNREGDSADDIKKTFTVDDFNGADFSGEWELLITDSAGQDTGTLNSWSIEITK